MSDNREQFIKVLEDLGIEVSREEDGIFISSMFVRVELLPELLQVMEMNEKLEKKLIGQ